MPSGATLAFNYAGKKLFDTGFFAGEGVENSINAMELKRARCLVGKSGSEVAHGMFEHVYAVNTHVPCLSAENLSRRWCDSAWRGNRWCLCWRQWCRFVHPQR